MGARMAGTDANTLLIKVNATTELLRQQMVQVNGAISDFESRTNAKLGKVDGHFARLSGSVSKFNAVLAGAAGGLAAGFFSQIASLPGTLIATTKAALEYAGSLGETSQQLGIGTKFLQEFRFAAGQNGTTTEQADKALGKFSITLGQAFNNSSSTAGKALEKLGLNLATLGKSSDSERFAAVADAIAKIPDPAQRAAAAVALFGKGGLAILPTLEAGAKGFRAQADEAQRYGLILSDGQIQNADKTADKIAALTAALQAKVAGVVADNAQAIGQLANSLADLAGWAVKAGQQFIGFANIIRNQGVMAALGTYRGADLAAAGTSKGNAVSAIRGAADGQRRLANAERQATYAPNSIANQNELKAARAAAAASIANAKAAVAAAKSVYAPSARTASVVTGGDAVLGGDTGGGGGGGGGRARSVRAVKTEVDNLRDVLPDTIKMLNDLEGAFSKPEDSPSAQFYSKVLDSQGIDPNADLTAIVAGIDKRKQAEFDANRVIADNFAEEYQNKLSFAANLYEDLFNNGTKGLWDNFKNIGSQVISQVLGKLTVGLLSGKGSGSLDSLFSSSLKGILGFAGGGSPPVNRVSVVGEKGPELFVPSVKGTIIPNNMLGGGGGNSTTIVNRFDLRGAVTTQDIMNQINAVGAAAVVGASDLTMTRLAKSQGRRLA